MIDAALALAAQRLGNGRDAVLARVGGPLGTAARSLATKLPDQRARAETAARVRAPVPEGLRGIHPTWIEAALASLPERARAAVAASGGDPVDVWLARWATHGFVAMPVIRSGPPRDAATVAATAAGELALWLANVGLDQVAHALVDQPALEHALVSIRTQLDVAAARIRVAPRKGQLGPVRAALVRCAGMTSFDDAQLVEIGARTIAPFVSAIVRLQIATRLPHPIGVVVLRALREHFGTPLDRCPAWPALVA